MPQADSDPEALHARVEQWLRRGVNISEAEALIRDLAAEHTRLRAQLVGEEKLLNEHHLALAACEKDYVERARLQKESIGKHASEYIPPEIRIIPPRPLRPEPDSEEVTDLKAQVAQLQAQLHAAEATIKRLRIHSQNVLSFLDTIEWTDDTSARNAEDLMVSLEVALNVSDPVEG